MQKEIIPKSTRTLEARKTLVKKINMLLEKGFGVKELGLLFGFSYQYISAIKRIGVEYPISLHRAEFMIQKADEILNS